jgi:hypothetical protein
MMDWQPIETAPKDGVIVLAVKESTLPWAKDFSVARFPYPLKQRWNGGAWEADDGHVYEPQPTHWMPLPAPPAEGE